MIEITKYKIKANQTLIIVGEIQSAYLPASALMKNGELDLNKVEDVCISGLYRYHQVNEIAQFDYTRPGNFPINKLNHEKE